MNIEEWLKYINKTEDSQYDVDFEIAERYANYKMKELNGSIFEFRTKLDKICDDLNEYWGVYAADRIVFQEYDKHFNIEQVLNGKI
jgi:hypothetical protein